MKFIDKTLRSSFNLKTIIKNTIKLGIVTFIIGIFVLGGINIYIRLYSTPHIQESSAPIVHTKVGLILGAAVRGEKLSDILKDRVDSAMKLFNEGKISVFLVSGDNSTQDYNEVITIWKYMIKNGIPEEKIYLDYAGFDTYDSMYRAKNVFGVNEMIIFTQEFHLSRSVYIARRLGIDAKGYISDLHTYKYSNYYNFREFFSRIKAFMDVEVLKSKPKFLGEKINIY